MRKVLAMYPSKSSNTMHEVRRGEDGVVYCTCPGWRFHQRRWCKHLEAYMHKPNHGLDMQGFKEKVTLGNPIDLVTQQVIEELKRL